MDRSSQMLLDRNTVQLGQPFVDVLVAQVRVEIAKPDRRVVTDATGHQLGRAHRALIHRFPRGIIGEKVSSLEDQFSPHQGVLERVAASFR